jgi:hypothetical protein
MTTRRLLIVSALACAACKPDLGAPASDVEDARIIGVRIDPPEAAPGATVSMEVLAVSPQGRLALPNEGIAWALCNAPKPPAENNVVSSACSVTLTGLESLPVSGPLVQVPIPIKACSLHGPDTPPTKPGEPPIRPRDPDRTGGYYQPVAVQLIGLPEQPMAFGLTRLSCNLPGVALDVAQEFGKRYKPNVNPKLAALTIDGTPVTAAPGGATQGIPAGRSYRLDASWTPESRESFPVYDQATQKIVDRFEQLTVSWFATQGELDRDRTGRTQIESESVVSNVWLAPVTPGPVTLWLVLRDDRGGLDFAEYHLDVTP